MQQKTLIALGALVAIAVLSFFTLRMPEKGERRVAKQRPIAAFKATDVKEIEITSAAAKDKAPEPGAKPEQVALKLDGTVWSVAIAGKSYRADQQLAKTAADQLEKLTFGDLVTEKKEKYANLEVSDDKGTHVVAKDGGGKVLLDAWMGKAVSGFTMLRPVGKEQVWQAGGIFKYTYARDAKQWRDHAIFEFAQADVSRIALEAAGQKVVLEKPQPAGTDGGAPAEAKWRVTESTVKLDGPGQLDDGAATALANGVATLRAAEFDDTATLASAGLSPPKHRITITVKGQTAVLLIGATKGEDVSVAVEGKPTVYLLKKYAVERIAIKPVDLRDKTLAKAKEDDLAGLDVTSGAEGFSAVHEGAAWKAAKGAKVDLDDAKVKAVAGAFENLQGASFAESTDPKLTGLLKPAGSATLKLRDGGTVKLLVGSLVDDAYHVQKVGSPDVLMVKKFAVDRFMKKPADVSKSK